MCDSDGQLQCHTSCHAQTAQHQQLHIHICYTVSRINGNKQTCSHSSFGSQQFQVMVHLKEITIILLNTLPVTEFRSTQNLPQIHVQLRVGSIKSEGDLTHK